MNIPKLTPRQRSVFSAIYAVPDRCLAELARELRIDGKTTGHAVYQLERLGLIETGVRHTTAKGRENLPITRRHCRPAAWTLA